MFFEREIEMLHVCIILLQKCHFEKGVKGKTNLANNARKTVANIDLISTTFTEPEEEDRIPAKLKKNSNSPSHHILPTVLVPSARLPLHQHQQERVNPSILMLHPIQQCDIKNNNAIKF